MRRICLAVLVAGLLATAPASAIAAPVATSDASYAALGRVFPDPLAACSRTDADPCSPHAQGNVPATQFIQYGEFTDALRYMNQRGDWQRYLEVWPLDGKVGDGAGTNEKAAFPGNNLGSFEFTPRPDYHSAGVPTSTLDRKQSDLFVLRVTDETVPDAGKKRMTISLSIHGIERAGLEGGTRAMEDFVTAATTGKAADPIVPGSVKSGAPTFGDVLRKTVIYFTYPNPDGWRRGSVSEGGVFFQRYNGNGVDPNRDWPDIGYAFRGYSGGSEPETQAFQGFYRDVRAGGARFDAGDDLHGQPFADALSYTLLPHGRHDLGKDTRIRETAKTIHAASYEALKWSPMIQPDDAPRGGGAPCPNVQLGNACAKIYGQTWGSVYDTINYTTTGTLGDWFDSSQGLGADGIDNEMSFSHLDKNIVFDPHTEQLHVDGNKALLFAHLTDMLSPVTGEMDPPPGRQGYVPNRRLQRSEQTTQAGPPPGTHPQEDISQLGAPSGPEGTAVPFQVQRTPTVYNGGMRVDITTTNVDGIQPGDLTISMKVQCNGCDEHVGVKEKGDWVTVSEDWNQAQLYGRAGLTAAVNKPDALQSNGAPVQWRALVSPQAGPVRMQVHFSSGPASTDGGYTAGGAADDPPKLRAYDVANTDFLTDLNRFIPDKKARFAAIDPRQVIGGLQSLSGLRTLVLADELLPGYTGAYAGEVTKSGPPTQGLDFQGSGQPTTPSQGAAGCVESPASTQYSPEFTIGPNDANASMRAEVTWETPGDYDLNAERQRDNGEWEVVKQGQSSSLDSEQVEVVSPEPGKWRIGVVNCTGTDPNWKGTVRFTALPPASGPGDYTFAEKDAWVGKLADWVRAGGHLILTDGALRGLGEFALLPGDAVKRQTVYAGQMTFAADHDGDGTSDGSTLDDPLARNVKQPGARFSAGGRRQTYEPTPLGFAIQDALGGDAAFARQYDIDIKAFDAAGGRTAATSANSGARDAKAVYDRVTLGELPLGAGSIRVAGGLLPQPSTAFDHPLGLEPYAMTYTGYILFCNLVDADCRVKPATSTTTGGKGGGKPK